MSNLFQCVAEHCSLDAVFICTCKARLCQNHQSTHLEANFSHSTSFLFVKLADEELAALKTGVHELDVALHERTEVLLKERQTQGLKLCQRLETLNAESSRKLQVLTSKKSEFQNVFSQVLEKQALPVHPLTPSFDVLLQAKNGDSLTPAVIETVIRTAGFEPVPVPVKVDAVCDNSLAVSLSKRYLTWVSKENKDSASHRHFSSSSRCLQLNSDTILVTGGECGTFACLVSATNCVVTCLPNLKVGRKFHAMALIEGKPAAIGGFDGVNYLTSVEVLSDWQWEKHSKLVEGRWSHAAASLGLVTYVFGGLRAPTIGTNSIEKHFEGRWTRLAVGLSMPMHSIGACVWPDEGVLLIGGRPLGSSATYKGVVAWTEESSQTLCKLESPMCFPQSAWVKGTDQVTGFNADGELCQVKVQRGSSCVVF